LNEAHAWLPYKSPWNVVDGHEIGGDEFGRKDRFVGFAFPKHLSNRNVKEGIEKQCWTN
jgi:hypothetical protein